MAKIQKVIESEEPQKVSQSELGKYLNLSRANVSRQLGRLKEANVIELLGTQILIIDEGGLMEIAGASLKD